VRLLFESEIVVVCSSGSRAEEVAPVIHNWDRAHHVHRERTALKLMLAMKVQQDEK
jgi:hypothetical protein